MHIVQEPAREIPVVGEAQVIVAGGGPAGAMAAIAAARAGADTLLIERAGCAGGIWTSGLLSWMLDVSDKEGLLRELMNRLCASKEGQFKRSGNFIAFPEAVKRELDDMLLQAGVRILYYSTVCDARTQGERITHAIVESKAGRQAFAGTVFIDATGDGDLSALAGCRYALGKASGGETQPGSLIALMTGVDATSARRFDNSLPYTQEQSAKALLRREMERAGLSPSYEAPSFFHIDENLWLAMTTHSYGVNPFDPASLTAAIIAARRELFAQEQALRALGQPWEKLRIAATAPVLGIREGRRILGKYTVTLQDALEGRKHPDSVCRVNFPLDIHPLSPDSTIARERAGLHSQPYDIPLRALEAMDRSNLLLAGRLISGDFFAHSSYRVTGDAATLGEAAGREAARRVASPAAQNESANG